MIPAPPKDAMEVLDPNSTTTKSDFAAQKVRTENRERKKRWREQNEDRNKDNDLRCRVNKRANKLFGKGESEHKTRWIEEEFTKRQLKRKEKERKKNGTATGAALEDHTSPSSVSASSGINHLALHQQQLQSATQLLTSAAQFDSTAKTALALNGLIGGATANKTGGSKTDVSASAAAAAAAAAAVTADQEQLALAQLTGVLNDPNLTRHLIDIETQAAQAAANPAPPIMLMPGKPDHEMNGAELTESEYPMDAVLTLMQLNGSWRA
ncbi:hypothetical protein DFQ27_002719 [Actinomortierella ambigua]|uniref:DUF3020 domain-containing protein n=1 Tax=Actinomortierella ambigua TaxID=1343610 RepID=A0A9P6Q8X1_9FUNG|nr:hypothetical protein DFQ26_003927 [Actinomortierella ambigua]KAG0261891.1 hypothetical protein DFQ27_002719 [Actinomortierella ambigua]